MRAAAFCSAALVALTAVQAAPAFAEDSVVSPVLVQTTVSRAPAPLTDLELDSLRGGFFSKEWGQQLSFGAVLTTYINGRVAMATQLTMSRDGMQRSVSTDAASGAAQSAAKTDTTSQTLTAASHDNSIGGQQEPAASPLPGASLAEQAASAGIQLNDELASWNGVVVPGEGGGTAVLQDTDVDHIAQIILNTANGVDIRQNTNITMDIPGFAQLQQTFVSDQLRSSIQDQVGSALGASLRR